MGLAPAVRFWRHVRKTRTCWLWTGAITKQGYGNFAVESRRSVGYRFVVAHRWAYEHLIGPIPEGLQLDHLCRNRACVRPSHLEVVTNQENSRRGLNGRLPKECVHGHPWTPENTLWRKDGRRRCRECARLAAARANAKRRPTKWWRGQT